MEDFNTVNLYLESLNADIDVKKIYYSDGSLWSVETRFKGCLHGKQFIFARSGELYTCVEYDMGKPVVVENALYDN